MHQFSYTRMTPYFRLNTSNWWVITQAYEWSWNPEYSSWTKSRALIYDYSKIPSKTSQLTNDSGFITSASIPTDYVKLTWNQTINWTKTFGTSPVVPSKTADVANAWTAIATEWQVYKILPTVMTASEYSQVSSPVAGKIYFIKKS